MIRRFFSPPVFEGDNEKTRAAELVNTMLFTQVGIFVLAFVGLLFSGTRPPVEQVIAGFVFLAFMVGLLIALRRGYVTGTGIIVLVLLTLLTGFTLASNGTIREPIIAMFILASIFAGLAMGRRAAVVSVIVNILIVTGITYGEINRLLPQPESSTNSQHVVLFAMAGILAVVLLNLALHRQQEALEQVQASEEKLSTLNAELEQRVNDRTAELEMANQQTSRHATQLQAITELSESIAKLQDLGELFPATTKLISDKFGFYHVGIFLVDSQREFALMQASNSEGGLHMLERGHRLKLGIGVVGYAAQTGLPRIALDVGADAVFFDNPDLPGTRSEVALPLKSRNETIGVLDVQSTESGAFSEEDLQVLTTLANQVSIAFENARLLTETRAALAQVQEVYDEFTRAEWSRTVAKAEQAGFRYQSGRIEMIEEPLNTAEVVSAVTTGEVVVNQVSGAKANQPTVAVPVKLRGEVIGILQIESNDPLKTWQADEISLVEAVAERAAFAMENARLFQDARKRASKERLISEATTKISGAFSIENILQTTAQELERVLGGSEVLIQFQNREQS